MPKYALVRQFNPLMRRSELDGIALANMATLESYIYRGGSRPKTADHGIRWVRSYWEEGGYWGMCLYEAPNLEILQVYQDLCGMPVLDAREVVDLPGPLEGIEPSGEGERVAVSFRLKETGEAPQQQMERLAGGGASADAGLVRTYWSATQRIATGLFSTRDGSAFAGRVASVADVAPAKIVEVTPDEYR